MRASASPPALRRVPRDVLVDRNVLCRRRRAVDVPLLGAPWRARLVPHVRGADALVLRFDWGGALAFLCVPAAEADAIVARVLGVPAAAVPHDVLLAGIEFALHEALATLQASARKHVRLAGVSRERPTGDFEAFGWEASDGDATFCGELLLDAAAMRYLAVATRDVATAGEAHPGWDALALAVRFVVARMELPASEVHALAPRDVLLPDESWLDGDGCLWVQVGRTLGFRARLGPQGLEVASGLDGWLGEEMDDMDTEGDDTDSRIDDVPLRLTFDVGERSMTLADVRSLQPGYLFNLGRDPRASVAIRANGRLIGEGELVDIEGRIGVSIVRIGPGQD